MLNDVYAEVERYGAYYSEFFTAYDRIITVYGTILMSPRLRDNAIYLRLETGRFFIVYCL